MVAVASAARFVRAWTVLVLGSVLAVITGTCEEDGNG